MAKVIRAIHSSPIHPTPPYPQGQYKVSERNFGMAEVTRAISENRLLEMFGTGTACVVSPIKEIVFSGQRIAIPTMDNNAEETMAFYHQLQDIQVCEI